MRRFLFGDAGAWSVLYVVFNPTCILVPTLASSGKVERQAACFFRVTVDERQAANGLLVSCRSYSKGKFKILLFDHTGEVLHHEESYRSNVRGAGGRSEATLYFTPFETYRLGEAVPEALREEDVPPVLGQLENFHKSRLPIQQGQHLICIYGDNFIGEYKYKILIVIFFILLACSNAYMFHPSTGKTSFTVLAVPSLNDCPDVEVMQELDEQVLLKQAEMAQLQEEYLEARSKFQALERRVKEEAVVVSDLVVNRDAAYINYLESSVRTYLPSDPDADDVDSDDQPIAPKSSWLDGVSVGSGILLGGLSGLQGGLQSAPVVAVAATGWLSASLSSKCNLCDFISPYYRSDFLKL